jgi:hypothetical protein
VLFSKGRPTRDGRDLNGIMDLSDNELIEQRLPYEKIENVSVQPRVT